MKALLPIWLACLASAAFGQTLAIPDRATNALTGSEFGRQFERASLDDREAAIRGMILRGDVPAFLRRLNPVEVTNVFEGRTNFGRFFVTPDYLALGHEGDYLLMPMTPGTAQHIADSLACTLPTRKMVDAIYAAAELKLSPASIPPGPAMTTLPVFVQHNEIIHTQRAAFLISHPLGALVAGHKKDIVISAKLATATNKVAIYGWHRTGSTPIQPLYTGHSAEWADYSHGVRLVSRVIQVNDEAMDVASVLANPKLAGLISDEGAIANARYPATLPSTFAYQPGDRHWPHDFVPANFPGELMRELRLPGDVRVLINTPGTNSIAAGKTILLIFYALPNGNTIEQTIGKNLSPGDDWQFDIQHIGAQTRFIREVLTNRNVVVTYLENALRSWPTWRRQYGHYWIPQILEVVKRVFGPFPVEVVLTGHSGGGSLTFGYLDTVADIPPHIQRIAFLDSNYAYETTKHLDKLTRWLKASGGHQLCVLAYHDAVALLEGKPFVSAEGGTWGRSHAMLDDLSRQFRFTSRTNLEGLATHSALDGRIQLLLKENPDRKILHTVQVERNGFIHAMLSGTTNEGKGYEYLGPRAYSTWIAR